VIRVGTSDLLVSPLCLGGNVFGWTLDAAESFPILDAFIAGGGNFIDTADSYAAWVEGNVGGESESIIGRWLRSRRNRDEIVLATKVGELPTMRGLSKPNIAAAAEASLRRLGTDRIDLYYAHFDDPSIPIAETLGAFEELIRAGKVRYVAASNYDAPRLREALTISEREKLAGFIAFQTLYNVLDREYEGDLRSVCEQAELACFPYRSLAKGFLTGKYQPGGGSVRSAHAERAQAYMTARGVAVLRALDEIALEHGVQIGAVALAWLAAQPTVVAPIASARTVDQLRDLLAMTELRLDDGELARITLVAVDESGYDDVE
jgi:aryl-alcohol dehydrogenase-like predicted oxidoreductase